MIFVVLLLVLVGVAGTALIVRGPCYRVYDNLWDEVVKATYTYHGARRWAKRSFASQSRWYVRYK